MDTHYDMLVIGGGINGTGIARDAAGRGQKVLLVEKGDLAGATSSASSKLIHGGLRYLEHYEFALVRESLQERERLWAIAPHMIRPLRFVLPHHKELRPAWLVRLGLFLYDHIGGRKRLPATKTLNLRQHKAGSILSSAFTKAFEYSDCWVDDARLVVANAQSARTQGATIMTNTRFTCAYREGNEWHATFQDVHGNEQSVTASAIVNAAGPWVKPVLEACASVQKTESTTLLVKGSHIIVPRLYDEAHAYTFQSGDGRVIFTIPYEGDFTLIGTTDRPYEDDLNHVSISDDEVSYLCEQVSNYLAKPVQPSDVVWSYAGVRPLYNDGSSKTAEATRDYVLELDTQNNKAPILSVFGGKITTYRRLAQDALEKLSPYLNFTRGDWTDTEALAGGDISNESPQSLDPASSFQHFLDSIYASYPALPNTMLKRMTVAYGRNIHKLLTGVKNLQDMGAHFGADLYEKEVRYLIEEEWATTADDIIWRRSKLGLRLTAQEQQRLADYMKALT